MAAPPKEPPMTNFPPADDDHAVDAQYPPTPPTAPAAPTVPASATADTAWTPPPSPRRRSRALGVIAAIALVLGPAVFGYAVGQNHDSSNASSAIPLPNSNS